MSSAAIASVLGRDGTFVAPEASLWVLYLEAHFMWFGRLIVLTAAVITLSACNGPMPWYSNIPNDPASVANTHPISGPTFEIGVGANHSP
jgi:hypothetical protein